MLSYVWKVGVSVAELEGELKGEVVVGNWEPPVTDELSSAVEGIVGVVAVDRDCCDDLLPVFEEAPTSAVVRE